ncbi:MAG: penicillin-binding protein 2 [Acidimicrobiales bacterium]|nr:penicillin-binding protein 2 [Acidimicrobiales bacterium]
MTADSPRLRLGVIAIIALSLFAALFARLWYLQVLSAPDYQLKAQANSIRIVPEPAPRGRILDRNGKVLVDNRASNVVAIDRTKLTEKERPELMARLSTVLGIPAEELDKKLDSKQVSPYTPVPIAEDVGEDKMTLLLERADQFPAVVARRVAVRTYPMQSLAAHILGYVAEVNDNDRKEFPRQYELGDMIGRTGVERVYEKDLRGRDGELKIEVDAEGRPVRVVSRRPPAQGHDVVLTIDADIQRTAEEALAQGLKSAQGQPFVDPKKKANARLVADAGSVVVLDTKGSVEALASYPTFDLPALADGVSEAEARVLFPPPDSKETPAFVNRALQGLYAPGSTWKLITADAALRTGLINQNFSLVDNGTYITPGDCTGRSCVRHNAGSTAYGRVGVSRALSVSSDVFFYTLGANFWTNRHDPKYGENAIQDVAGQFGFGTQTGVPLPEATGRVLTKELKNALHQKDPRLADAGWYTGNNVNLAIGQDAMLVTPIQLANAYATFANHGDRYQPNIALRIQKQDGTVVTAFGPRKFAHVDIPPNVWNPIMQGLEGALTDPKGTATNAFAGFPLKQWGIAGKTGTAQATPKQDTALFAAFGPTADPQHVVTVVMEQSGFGASAAAPVARRVFEQLAGVGNTAPVQFTRANGAGD